MKRYNAKIILGIGNPYTDMYIADEVDTWIAEKIAELKWKIQDAEGDRSLQMFHYEEFVTELERIVKDVEDAPRNKGLAVHIKKDK